MKSITFINLPSPFLENQKWIPPLGIMSVATMCRALGYDVRMLDLAGVDSMDEFDRLVRQIETEHVAVSAVTPQYQYIARIPSLLPPRIHSIAGGIHASLFPDETYALGYSTVVVGDGEHMISLAMGEDGVLRSDRAVNIHAVPQIDRTLMPGYAGPAPIMAGRGCPYRCAFCAQTQHKVQMRAPQSIADEMLNLGTMDAIFYDDSLTASRPWFIELCRAIRGMGLANMRLRCSTRADKIDDEIASTMARSGFSEVCIGVESGSQKILDTVRKGTTVDENTDAVWILQRYGIKVKAFLMVGLPGETRETIEATRRWIEDALPDSFGVYIFNPLPGCDIYDHPEKYDIGFTRGNFSHSFYGGRRGDIESMVSTSSLTSDEITRAYHNLRFLCGEK